MRITISSTRMTDLWSRLGRHELALLVSVLAIAGGLLGFALLADEVGEGDTRSFDHSVMLALRTPSDPADPIGPPWVEEMARDLTSLGSITVLTLVSFSVAGFLILSRRRGAAVLVLTAVFGGMVLSTLLKAGFERPRPDLVPHAVEVFTKSFPSGHAMLSAVTYLTLGALLARVQPHRRVKAYLLILAVFLTLTIGISRVYLGVHWPTDVLAGWCVGATWAMLCWVVASWLQRRGHVEQDVRDPGNQE
jgi:undecaprenyl-diphosphatase